MSATPSQSDATPLVSCVISVFNGERYIAEALDSALSQTYRPVEVVVADDGSTDRTAEIAAKYEGRVRYMYQEHKGAAAAKNMALRSIEGELVAFLDADDLWHPDKLTLQVTAIQERPGIDLCFTNYRNFWVPELSDEERKYRGHSLISPEGAWSICTLLTRRRLFTQHGMFNEELRGYENTTWMLAAARAGAVIEVLPETLMYRRIHSSNQSRERALDDEFFAVVKAWLAYRREMM